MHVTIYYNDIDSDSKDIEISLLGFFPKRGWGWISNLYLLFMTMYKSMYKVVHLMAVQNSSICAIVSEWVSKSAFHRFQRFTT